MSHKIFLSHNYNDKPVVEPVAIKLKDIFGLDQVFYDSWSIKPGDGIIDKMNEGLDAPEFVFFFVSTNSLKSDMVKLEWQNALYSASKGKTRLIPIRVDGTEMPAILLQSLYIDMHTQGIEATISQIVSICQGDVSFTAQHQGFSNLSFSIEEASEDSITIVIRASHLMEPNPSFMFLVDNTDKEISYGIGDAFRGGFNEQMPIGGGNTSNGIGMRPMFSSLTPTIPLRATFTKIADADINLIGVMHERSENYWVPVPYKKV
mgnify:CR=1 FL=1